MKGIWSSFYFVNFNIKAVRYWTAFMFSIKIKKPATLNRVADPLNNYAYAFLARRDFLRAAAFLWISPFEAALSNDL